MKNFLPIYLLISIYSLINPSVFSQNTSKSLLITKATHPDWILQGNVYEVNLRQFTKEGSFKAFARHLPRLKTMGVNTLWFMPIYPIGVKDRKGVLGSYYAIKDYKAINPEFGTFQEWIDLVKRCHSMGFKVIIDWVANHTSSDHLWIKNHLSYYQRDPKSGIPVSPFDWTDVRKLDYSNKEMQDSMIESMKFWLIQSEIDGFRCDVANEVPEGFWIRCIKELKKIKNIFMLAEGETAGLHKAGFDATYTWSIFNVMKDIASGKRKTNSIDTALFKADTTFGRNALRLYFTSNHDENTWNKADYGTMPGKIHAPFSVLTFTLPHSVPLIYSGQEEPFLDSLSFFYKNNINFKNYQREPFYSRLLKLKSENPALNANATFVKIHTGADDKIFAFIRMSGDRKVLVMCNLSNEKVIGKLKHSLVEGSATELFSNEVNFIMNNASVIMQPWDFEVWVY